MKSCVFFCLLAGAAWAAPAGEARRIEERFLAPCCWSESLAFHNSPKAVEMREEVEGLVAAGKSEAQIVDLYVARYGERILREPRGGRRTVLTLGPLVALALGGTLLVVYLRRVRPVAQAAGAPVAAIREEDLDW